MLPKGDSWRTHRANTRSIAHAALRTSGEHVDCRRRRHGEREPWWRSARLLTSPSVCGAPNLLTTCLLQGQATGQDCATHSVPLKPNPVIFSAPSKERRPSLS
ncbi:hypothetical protein AAHC03_025456 [Spirometra sp. Aus1]